MQQFRRAVSINSSGLRPYHTIKDDPRFLYECFNMRVEESGLESFEVPSLISPTPTQSVDWPFPQIFTGLVYRLLATETQVFLADDSWNLYAGITVPAGGYWVFVDFGEYFLLLNGSVMVYIDPTGPPGLLYATTFSSTPRTRFGINYGNQFVGGNVRSTWYDCDFSSVMWSQIMSIDSTPSPNRANYGRPPFLDEIVEMGILGRQIIVYSKRGIAAMTPSETGYGFRKLAGHRVVTAGCSESSHVFLSDVGDLYRLTLDGARKLGYREFMSTLTLANVRIIHDQFQDFYISDGVRSFLLSPFGLSEVSRCVTSVTEDGVIYLDLEDDECRLTSVEQNFRLNDYKTIFQVNSFISHNGGSGSVVLETALKYRYGIDTAWVLTPWVRAGMEGMTHHGTAAREFQVRAKLDNHENVSFHSLYAYIQKTDNRFTRGLYGDLETT